MTKQKSTKRSFFALPLDLTVKYEKKKTETKKILEFNPKKLKPGELITIKVKKWLGLSSRCFAILNMNGEKIMVAELS